MDGGNLVAMTRQQVLRKQLTLGFVILVGILIAVGIRGYTLTFAHQIHLGRLKQATLASEGPLLSWTDEESLARLQAALPRYAPGAGFFYLGHTHGGELALALTDENNKSVALLLPMTPGDTQVSLLPGQAGVKNGNAWSAPRLLTTLAELGLEHQKKYQDLPPGLVQLMESWRGRTAAPTPSA